MEVKCPECRALLRIADENAHRQARCPSCSAVFTPTPPSHTPTDELSPADSDAAPSPFAAPIPPGASPANPYAPSYTEPAPQPQGSSDWAPRQITVDEVLSKAWAVFKQQWGMACVAVVIVGGINIGLSMGQNLVTEILKATVNDPAIFFVALVAMFLATQIIGFWLQIGQAMIMLDIARGQPVIISKLFAGGPYLLHTILAWILIVLMIGSIVLVFAGIPAIALALAAQEVGAAAIGAIVGGVIALVPAIIVLLMFSQFMLLIIDRGLGAIGALQTSYEITNGNKLMLFVILIAVAVIFVLAVIVGLLALCVGLIVTMIAYGAFASLVMAVTYLCMTGQYVAEPGSYVGPQAGFAPSDPAQ